MNYLKPFPQLSKRQTEFSFLDPFHSYGDIQRYYSYIHDLSTRDIQNLQNQIYVCWTQMIHKGYVTLPNRLPSPNETTVSLDTYLQDFVSDKSDKVHPLCKCIFLMNVIATSLI